VKEAFGSRFLAFRLSGFFGFRLTSFHGSGSLSSGLTHVPGFCVGGVTT
jgi:hypothetical protein